ncbi:MAG TPA: very short patch repair endonuclease [Chondromyces sp.]|nr:very short patch repair endonuclease [Chondromyces sp.]
MADIVSKEQRSKIMGSIKAKSKLEDMVASELWNRGIRFRRNVKSMYGTPDIALKKYKIVIFIDSCFFHFCPIHGRVPKSNQEFWLNKFEKNIERDRKVSRYYYEENWDIMRVWEHEIRKDFENTIRKIINLINYKKKVYANRF